MRAKISAVPPAAKGTITDTCLEGYASSAFEGADASSTADARISHIDLIEVSSACYWLAAARPGRLARTPSRTSSRFRHGSNRAGCCRAGGEWHALRPP